MRLIVLSLIALITVSEAFAQRAPRGPRYNPPGHDRYYPRPDPRRDHRPDPRYDRPDRYDRYDRYDYRPVPGRVVITPRTTYRPGRVYRDYRRQPIIWSAPFGYSCSMYGDLLLNGRRVHTFRFSMDCHQAITDIRLYGDFCDNEIMYDQSGYMEAAFYTNYECRDALGWYY